MQVINWFPGHMKKTHELIQSHLKLVDVVVEVLDARLPVSSKNPHIEGLIAQKPRIIVFNKYDLSDPGCLEAWTAHYQRRDIAVIPVNALNGEGIPALIREMKTACQKRIEKLTQQGRQNISLRVMIVGIPNVGKSSLINRLAGRNSAKVGNKPGVTRGKQWIRINQEIELFDTPGILWPKIEDPIVGRRLAWTGAIRDEILDMGELALEFLRFMQVHYPEAIRQRYQLERLPEEALELMEEIGRVRGCLLGRGEIDYEKVANLILDDFRRGRLGRITLDPPVEA